MQRDYLFGWVISGIFRESNLAERVTLKGGNALRKGYLPGTRFSDDLDFSTRDSLDGDAVLAELNRVCKFASDATAVQFDIGRNRKSGEHQIDCERHVFKYRLHFKDMIGDRDHVTISIRVDMTELIRVTYHGVTRIMEPYSLAFKRRNDGVAQEYFYVWDRTGGLRSGPGIKTLVHYDVQALEVTDE